VLLGTDSFWEGIDVPGVALELVVIVRLPFLVPSEPVLEAIAEDMTARGEDPFAGYALPRTALRLKQGFGRLIRTRNDRGSVIVLDRRIVRKRYGAYLQRALPVRPQVADSEGDFLLVLERWQDGIPAGKAGTRRRLDFIE
jgi:ATP-dependent DNA helicase DinG